MTAVALAGSVLLAPGPLRASALGPPAAPPAGVQAPAGDPGPALADQRAYVEAHPEDAAAGRRLGDAYFASGDVRDAEQVWQLVVAAHPSDDAAHMRLAALYAAANEPDRAIREYDAVVPTQVVVAALLRLHERVSDLQHWIDSVVLTADLNPFDVHAVWLRANVLQARRDPEAALADYARVVGLRNKDCLPLLGLAGDQVALRRFDDAVESLQRCLALDPNNDAALTVLGDVEIKRNDLNAALSWLDQALDLSPSRADALVDRGYIEDVRGDVAAALRDDRAAIAADPTLPEPYANIGLDLLNGGALVEAQEIIQAGLRVAPESGRLHYLLAATFRLEGQPVARSRAEFTAALKSDEVAVVQAARAALAALVTAH